LTLLVCSALAWTALAQRAPAPPVVRPSGQASPPIATVAGRNITRADFEQRANAALAELARRSGTRGLQVSERDVVRRQALEGLIRLQLLILEARRQGLAGSATEAEEILKREPFFNPGGKFDPQRFLSVKTMQNAAYQASIAALQEQLAARQLNQRLEEKFLPSEAASRTAARHTLERVTLDHLSLRFDEFAGTFAEPRESDVVDYYRAHLADYRRLDRATITVAFVNVPGLTDEERRNAVATAAWTKRMRAVADSVLALVRGGAGFDSVAAFLGPRPNIVVESDNFPGYWLGTASQSAFVFDPRNAGKVLPEPVAASEGVLLVRVDEVQPSHVSPLREVSREIRALLRRDRRLHHEEYEQRALYERLRDSLSAPGWRFRVAAVDTGTMALPEPSPEELDRYYRGHQADYSSFDARTGAIVSRTLAEVRDDVRRRLLRERRALEGRLLAEGVFKAWSAGRRDPEGEARMGARELPPVVAGSVIDTGLVATTLSDTLWARDDPSGTGMLPYARGWIVWQSLGRVARVSPTLAQARTLLAERLAQQHDAEEEAGAHALFRADSMRFNLGNVVYYSRFTVYPSDILHTPLTRAEVEKWHRDHIDRYSAPEMVRARHILIEPGNDSPAADRAALEKAQELLRRLQAGEDFATLAQQSSDDAASRDQGGDLGSFGRGAMLEAFERAAFALAPGQIAPQPVRTPLGYHLVQCLEHQPAVIHPLGMVYSVVGADAATAKADERALHTADSILALARTPATLERAARRTGTEPQHLSLRVGDSLFAEPTRPYFQALRNMRPGEVMRTPFRVKGSGYWVSWVDSVGPPSAPTWADGRAAALAAYRKGAGRRAVVAKRAELDSLAARGTSYDSLAALWGGPERVRDLPMGRGLPSMGGADRLDSLIFGGGRGPQLVDGVASSWLELPNGLSRVRVLERAAPPADQVSERAVRIRAAELERGVRGYFEELKARYPVRILDAALRDTPLPEPPPAMLP
jgi:parvulin-like peptidyl-prolyl isomerase